VPTLILCFVFLGPTSTWGQYTPAPTQQTIWGGNQRVVVEMSKSVRIARGVVLAVDDKALESVLVEVYDHPEVLIHSRSDHTPSQTRIAACMTDVTGAFAFTLPVGDYELRCSKSSGWDVTSTLIRVRRSVFSSAKGLVLRLYVGT
jgi:hypothetical protein